MKQKYKRMFFMYILSVGCKFSLRFLLKLITTEDNEYFFYKNVTYLCGNNIIICNHTKM